METNALIFTADTGPYRDAVVLGQGLPLEKDGQPVRYYWKEMLPVGRFIDKDKKPFEVTPQRIEGLIANFKRAKSKGFIPMVLSAHNAFDAKNSLGTIIDVRKNQRGALEGLHQLVGDDAIKAASRNGSSICTVFDATDEHGETYAELIHHNAIIPNPQLRGLTDFQPAIAASRGQAMQAVILELAAPNEESEMDLTPLRDAIGAAKEVTDEKLIEAVIAELGKGKEALTLSAKVPELEQRATAAEAKALELSAKPDPKFIAGNATLADGRLQLLLDKGCCTEPQAKLVREQLIKADGPAAGLMLSQSAYTGPLDTVFKILELNSSAFGRKTGDQGVTDLADPSKDKGGISEDRMKELLGESSLGRGILAGAK